MDADRDALIEEIDDRLQDIASASAQPGVCAAHGALTRGVATILRCQRAQMRQRAVAAASGAISGTVAGTLLIGIIEAVKALAV